MVLPALLLMTGAAPAETLVTAPFLEQHPPVIQQNPGELLEAHASARNLAADFEAIFRQHIHDEGILGAAFVVATPLGVVHAGAAGHTDTSRGQTIDENTPFRIASVSKTFAAGLTGLLVRDGWMRWDDPLIRYLPDFRINGDAGKVQLSHLLGQSTGLMPHAYDNLIEDGLPVERILPHFSKLSYLCTPGLCYSYQNSLFSLIEPVIEQVTARTYGDLMEERIFQPLNMHTASVGFEPFVNDPKHAKPHVRGRGRWITVPVQPNYYRVAPAAGVNASALDMGKWLQAQMGGAPAIIDSDLIRTLTQPRVKTIREMRRKHWRGMLSEAHYGLGWRVYQLGEHRIAYHSGWVSGYRADLAWSQELGIGVAVLMNVESNTISQLTTTFWEMVFASAAPPAVAGVHRTGPGANAPFAP
ncbi:MAG: serine hydrolase domain-containing protein [Xanthomonadales bacterium]|nr:serine hydrolase domain-containing protein [Xanthomonadales bacterium]